MFPRVNQPSSLNNWDIELNAALFDSDHNEDGVSAIDSFSLKNKELNKLIIDPTGKVSAINQLIVDGEINESDGRKIIALLSTPNTDSKFLNLLLLGYVSSVEAYLRKLIRELVNLDPHVKRSCQKLQIDFGATYYQLEKMYPESLMSYTNFIKGESIIQECSKFLGFKIQKLNSNSLSAALKEFDTICELRHCIVHRFGNVGVKNLVSLGLHSEDLSHCIEKPIKLDFNSIQKVSKTTMNLVRELNHVIWSGIMERLRDVEPETWTWDLRSDKKLFTKYFKLFYEDDGSDSNLKLTATYQKYKNARLG